MQKKPVKEISFIGLTGNLKSWIYLNSKQQVSMLMLFMAILFWVPATERVCRRWIFIYTVDSPNVYSVVTCDLVTSLEVLGFKYSSEIYLCFSCVVLKTGLSWNEKWLSIVFTFHLNVDDDVFPNEVLLKWIQWAAIL